MAKMSAPKQRERAEAMIALIEEYLSKPGNTQRAFCARHQIAYSTFHYYLAKHRRQETPAQEKPAGRFIPLRLPDLAITSGGQSACEIAWPGGVVIRFETNPSPEYLVALIKAGSNWR